MAKAQTAVGPLLRAASATSSATGWASRLKGAQGQQIWTERAILAHDAETLAVRSGWAVSPQPCPGFFGLWSLPSRIAWRVRQGDPDG
jgi:hypothetical protein